MPCAQHPRGPRWFLFAFLVFALITLPRSQGSGARSVDLNGSGLADVSIVVSAGGPIALLPQIPNQSRQRITVTTRCGAL